MIGLQWYVRVRSGIKRSKYTGEVRDVRWRRCCDQEGGSNAEAGERRDERGTRRSGEKSAQSSTSRIQISDLRKEREEEKGGKTAWGMREPECRFTIANYEKTCIRVCRGDLWHGLFGGFPA